MTTKNQSLLVSLILSLTILAVLLPNINKPFYGHHEFNGVFYSQIARNYIKEGLIKYRGAQVILPGSYHTHHPATYPLLLAGVYHIFGENEIVARGLSIVASGIGILLLSQLIQLLYPHASPLLSLSLLPLLVTPLFRYYARMPVFEPLLLPLIVAALIAYKKQQFRFFFLFSFLSILLDWPGYWPAFTIIGVELITNRNWRSVSTAVVSILLGTIVILLAQWISYGHPFIGFLDVGSTRLTAQPFTYLEWCKLLIARSKAFFSLPLLIACASGTICVITQKKAVIVAYITLGISLAHILVFRNITWYHDYMLYHALPFVAITLASFTYGVAQRVSQKVALSTLLVVPVVLAVLVVATTHRFYTDLKNMTPHKDCVENTWDRSSTEKKAECPPFTMYYHHSTGE